jgi:hypothetical protein
MKRFAIVLLAAALPACGQVRPQEDAPSSRLTPAEYNNTVRDLYGYATFPALFEDEEEEESVSAWPWSFPGELGVDGFDGYGEGQVPSPYLVEHYEAAAAHFAQYALQAPHFSTCGSWADMEQAELTACANASVLRFAQRAFRRGFQPGEQDRLQAFHDANVQQWGVADGTRMTVQGILQTPQFLYRTEAGEAVEDPSVVKLTDWEMASRLSYFLWDSMPDEELFQAASEGRLGTREQVAAQARRMLADPKARDAVVRFHNQWLELDLVFRARPDQTAYSHLYQDTLLRNFSLEDLMAEEELFGALMIGVRRGMLYEAELFIEKTVFEGGSQGGKLSDLLTDNHGYVTEISAFSEGGTDATTADLYGATELLPGETYNFPFDDGNLGYDLTLRPATFPADQRAGVLTLGAVLAGRSHPVHPAPVLRGKFLLERIACEAVGQPPESAAGTAPPDSLNVDATNRQRVEAITSPPVCAGCHERINPGGFAFEAFDTLGGYRTTDNGQPIDTSTTLKLMEGDTPVAGPVEMAQALANSRQVHDCYTQHWVRYAIGRPEVGPERAALSALQERFMTTGGDVQELLVAISASDLFRFRRTDDGAATAEGSE